MNHQYQPLRFLTVSGRADRLEYAWALAFAAIVAPLIVLALAVAGLDVLVLGAPYLAIWACFSLLHIAASIRRFHDCGMSAGWPIALATLPVLLPLTPILLLTYCPEACYGPRDDITDDGRGIGSALLSAQLAITVFPIGTLLFLILAFRRSDPNPNRYGPPPFAVTS